MVFFAYLVFFVLAFIFIILILGLSLLSRLFGGISNIIRLFGIGRKQNPHTRTYYNNMGEYGQSTSNSQGKSYDQQSKHHASQEHNSASNGKIFGSNEGEYVDFEEIKQ